MKMGMMINHFIVYLIY